MRHQVLLTSAAALCAVLTGACARTPAPPAAPAPAPALEAVPLRLRHHIGEALRSEIVTNTFVHMGSGEAPAGDTARPMVQASEFVTESVTAVSGDTFTVAYIVDSGHFTTPGFNLPAASQDSLLPHGLIMTMRMNSRGRVLSVQLDRTTQVGDRAVALRMLMGTDSSDESYQRATTFLPDLPAHAGDTWADTTPCPRVLHGCEGGVVTTYRLERIERSGAGRVAVISSRSEMPSVTLEQPMEITMGPTHTVAEARLDLETGWIVERSMMMQATAHSPMGDLSTRIEMRQTAVPGAAQRGAGATAPAGAAAAPPAAPPMPPGFLMRRGTIPTPTTLDSLIALFRHFEPTLQFPDCSLPDVAPGADWVTLQGPDDGVQVRLPQGWRAAATDTTPLGDPEAVLRDSMSGRILITRVTRASGLPHAMKHQSYGMPTELAHTGRCRLGGGTAGSVWTLYAPDPEASGGPLSAYSAMGGLITAGGRRYDVSVRAPSAEARDRIVRMVADAVRPPQ